MKIILQHILTFFCLFLLVYAIGIIFCESPICVEKDSKINLVVQRSGDVFQLRGENWMQTRFGNHGLEKHDSAKLTSSLPKVLFFGDSYVEAYMIPWDKRMQNQIEEYEGIGIGCSGASAPEFYAYMKHYEPLFTNVLLKVVILTNIDDIRPPKKLTQIFI